MNRPTLRAIVLAFVTLAACDKAKPVPTVDADVVPASVTKEWCTLLRVRVEGRAVATQLAQNPNKDPSFIRNVTDDWAVSVEGECHEAVGTPTDGYWTCLWDGNGNTYDSCKSLRYAARQAADGVKDQKTKQADQARAAGVVECKNNCQALWTKCTSKGASDCDATRTRCIDGCGQE
jgi:hypothetical protein